MTRSAFLITPENILNPQDFLGGQGPVPVPGGNLSVPDPSALGGNLSVPGGQLSVPGPLGGLGGVLSLPNGLSQNIAPGYISSNTTVRDVHVPVRDNLSVRDNTSARVVRDNAPGRYVKDKVTGKYVRDYSTVPVQDNPTAQDNTTVQGVRDKPSVRNVRDNKSVRTVRNLSAPSEKGETKVRRKSFSNAIQDVFSPLSVIQRAITMARIKTIRIQLRQTRNPAILKKNGSETDLLNLPQGTIGPELFLSGTGRELVRDFVPGKMLRRHSFPFDMSQYDIDNEREYLDDIDFKQTKRI